MSVRSKIRAMIALTTATLVGLLLTVGIDRVLGAVRYQGVDRGGLLFPPGSHARYEAEDFSFVSSINRMGFRDREFSRGKTARHRIVAIGDSYTYGWGVGIAESWPKELESLLRGEGYDVEVANLGSPGAGPNDYATAAETALPVLTPDLVILAVLEGDDLEQLKYVTQRDAASNGPPSVLSIRGLAHRLYPNLLRLTRETLTPADTAEITLQWQREVETIKREFTADEAQRYARLDPAIRSAFERGRLNPPLVVSGLRRPNYWMDTLDPNSAEVQGLVRAMTAQFQRIKQAAERYGAKVVIVSVPMGHYVDRHVLEQRRRYGFTMDDKMLTTDAEGLEIQRAATAAGFPFFNVTPSFRREAGRPLYFRWDTHFNAAGHEFFARQLSPIVGKMLGPPSD